MENLRETLVRLTEREDVNLIVTTGGTGFSPRDNTPEATRAVIEKEANGLSEAMRFETMRKTPFAMLSRGVCGIRNQTLIINLPGSPKGVRECFDVIKPVLSTPLIWSRRNGALKILATDRTLNKLCGIVF